MSVSFIHRGGPAMASYRYRASIPAQELGASVNDLEADILVFTKPAAEEIDLALRARESGRSVIVDFCDDHFGELPHYTIIAGIADAVTCPTSMMAAKVMAAGYEGEVTVIPDTYEFPEAEPHCAGDRLLWFGHGSNFKSLLPLLPRIFSPLVVVSNLPLARPWSLEALAEEFAVADIAILPATAPWKSPNRAVEAIRQGCFVVAEPHPSINEIPGIWLGDIPEGIEWASQNLSEANKRTRLAQEYVRTRFSPKTQACAWKSLFERVKSLSISAAAKSSGQAGSTSMDSILVPT